MLAYLEDEAQGQKVADLIADAHYNDIPLFMSVVNVGEVWYILAREVSETEADNAVNILRQLGIEFIDVDWKLNRRAGQCKAQRRMSYADCYAASLTVEQQGELVTGDREFQQVHEDVRIHWLTV
jgi:predicted nucleic acid-binding protein